jgi:crotonobetainyl-CoA:carnitine CoA-transferase CaiB-like acyl-CoA transferase
MLAGQDAAFAAVSALYARQRTGVGHVIDVALVDSMTRFLACRITPYLGSGEIPTRSGGKDSVIAIYQSFDTSDFPITLGLGNDNLWQKFWTAIGRPEVAATPGMKTNAERRNRRPEIVAMIAEILREKPRSHWLALLREARIPAGPINSIDHLVADEALLERGMFYRTKAAHGGMVPQVGTGIVIDGQSNSPRSMPPALGEHTEAVLQGLLGIKEDELRKLADKSVTGRK